LLRESFSGVNSNNHSDEELLTELQKGNKVAFEEIFNKYWFTLYRVAYTRTKSRQEAEEVVQDIFTALWKNHNTLLINNLSHYLYAAVRKRLISMMRSQVVHQKYWDYYRQFLPGNPMNTAETVELEELSNAIENAIGKLPEKSQQIFRLNRLQGLSIPEIEKFLKIPRRTIEHHLTKSIRELRIHLKDFIFFLLITSFPF
jgi:RNA polymerase sigma-70 factor (family 1)